MAIVTVGPEFAIDGPLPVAPRYTLVGAALIEGDGGERWANGIVVHSYMTDTGLGWSGVCDPDALPKESQQDPILLPEFGPLTVYVTETCTAHQIGSPEEFRARALAVFAAVESGAVEYEFWTGADAPGNPHLTDANADVIEAGAVKPLVGLAALEDAIAATRRRGVIHATPGTVTAWMFSGDVIKDVGGKLYTGLGTLVIPGSGYPGTGPGDSAVTVNEAWAYATGPVEVLRTSQPIIIPETIGEALDRTTNTVEYRAERYYIPFWDTALQAAILIDRTL